jgi:hypothetical protein
MVNYRNIFITLVPGLKPWTLGWRSKCSATMLRPPAEPGRLTAGLAGVEKEKLATGIAIGTAAWTVSCQRYKTFFFLRRQLSGKNKLDRFGHGTPFRPSLVPTDETKSLSYRVTPNFARDKF